MSFFKNTIVGIDFHDYSAQIVEISIRGRNKYLDSYNRVMIPSDVIVDGEIKKKEELKTILKTLFETANPHPIETKTVAITFPSSKVITHVFTFPVGLSEPEVRKAITYEAETIIPFQINDIYWDCAILEKEDKTKPHASQYVIFACINKQIADQYCELFEGIDTNPVLFSVMPDSLRYSLTTEMFVGKISLMIDVDTLGVNYLIVDNLTIKHFFSTSEGGHRLIKDMSKDLQLTEDEIIAQKEKNQLANIPEIEKIRTFIERNYKRAQKIIEEYEMPKATKKIQQILLTGEFMNLPNFIPLAKTYFPNQKVVIGDPKLGLIIEPTRFNLEAADKDEYMPYSIYFNNSIGSALRAINNIDNGINLLPDKIKENFSTKKKTLIIGITSVFVTIFSLVIAAYLTFQVQNLSYQQTHLLARKSAIVKMIYGKRYQEIKTQIGIFNTEVNDLSTIDSGLFSVPTMIKEIYKLMPQGVTITSFDFFDKELNFSISGIAADRDVLLETEKNLKGAEFIKQLVSPISNYNEKNNIPFQLTITLEFTKLQKYGFSSIQK